MDYDTAMDMAGYIAKAIEKMAEPRKENAVLNRVFSQHEQTPSGGWVEVDAWMLWKDKRLMACWLDLRGSLDDPDFSDWMIDDKKYVVNTIECRLQRQAMAEYDRLFELVEKEAAKVRENAAEMIDVDEIPF